MGNGMTTPGIKNQIKEIEELTARIADTMNDTLTQADRINGFFFGVVEVDSEKQSEEVPTTGWLREHIEMLKLLKSRILRIHGALVNMHDITQSK